MSKKKKVRKCWYFIHYSECVLCGSDNSYRERRYDERPDDRDKRVSFHQFACSEHFL